MQLDIAWQDMKQIAKGEHKAVQSNGGLRDREIAEFIRDYQLLSNGPARVMFADRWVRLMAWKMEETWPMLYGALNIIKEDKIYEHPEWMKSGLDRKGPQDDPENFSSFEEYFESRMGKPFTIWTELENTYQFAKKYAPELLGGGYEDARARIAELDEKDRAELKKQGPPKGNKNAAKDKQEKTIFDNIQDCFAPTGTSQQAGLRRLRNNEETQELYQQVLNGDLSVHSACVKAGFRSPTITIPIDPERAAKAILKRFGAEEIRKLIELLQTGG